IDPSLRLRELERAILRHDPSLRIDVAARPFRVPRPLTRTVGRGMEVAAVCALLREEDVRLLTLTGPGGVGKTRLALEVAAELAPAMTGGALFVDLAPLDDPALLAPTIATALGIGELPADAALATLVAELD